MSENLEIERKFLVEVPDFHCLDIKKSLDITQTYLRSKNCQRRIRCISEKNRKKFFYTEKVFITDVIRRENEYEISENEYNQLLCERETDYVPITKKRICFKYKKQMFELDIYPFSDKFAILELELDNAEQEIFFPDYINIVKEVTGINAYSNASLANAGMFPDESKEN